MSKFRLLIESVTKEHIDFDHSGFVDDHHDAFFEQHMPKTELPVHNRALAEYADDSGQVNRSLWSKRGTTEVNELADHVSNALKTAPRAVDDFHVYTGINARRNPPKGKLKIPAFTSASSSPIIAGRFVNIFYDRHTTEDAPDEHGINRQHTIHHILKIKIKKGQHVGGYIAHHGIFYNEKEFLINKGHTIHLTGEHEDHHMPPITGRTTPRIYRIHHATITSGN